MKSLASSRAGEVEDLLRMYTRKELHKMAKTLGLHPSKFRNKKELAKAILDALPSGK